MSGELQIESHLWKPENKGMLSILSLYSFGNSHEVLPGLMATDFHHLYASEGNLDVHVMLTHSLYLGN